MTKRFGGKWAFKFVSTCFKFVVEVDGTEGVGVAMSSDTKGVFEFLILGSNHSNLPMVRPEWNAEMGTTRKSSLSVELVRFSTPAVGYVCGSYVGPGSCRCRNARPCPAFPDTCRVHADCPGAARRDWFSWPSLRFHIFIIAADGG